MSLSRVEKCSCLGNNNFPTLKYSVLVVLAVIALAFASSSAQEIDCRDEFFRVARSAESCQDFLVCMIGGRVDFFCDEDHIFDADDIRCRRGNVETCEYLEETEVDDGESTPYERLSKFNRKVKLN